LLLLTLAACSESSDGGPDAPEPPVDCDPSTIPLADGSCLRPGVPPDGCGAGFVHDGEYGCEPILPAEPCPAGTMAVPGDESCAPVMECGQGRWGALPIDASTVYVDGSFTGQADGSEAAPWPTIGEAVTAAPSGSLVAVAAGDYVEAVSITKPLRLWGVCPELVRLRQAPDECPGAVCLFGSGDGSEVGGMAVTGTAGVVVISVEDVLLDRMLFHDIADRAVNVQDSFGPASIHLRRVLIEDTGFAGMVLFGAYADVEASTIRGTTAPAAGAGISASLTCEESPTGPVCDPLRPSSILVRGSLLESNQNSNLLVVGSNATVTDSVLRRGLARSADGDAGAGITASLACTDRTNGPVCDPASASHVTVARSVLSENTSMGIMLESSSAVVEATVVRDTLPRPLDQDLGRAINAQPLCANQSTGILCYIEARSSVELRSSLLERNHNVTMIVAGGDAVVASTVLRGTLPTVTDGRFGSGLHLQHACRQGISIACPPEARGSMALSTTLIEDHHYQGLFVVTSNLEIDDVVIRGIKADVVAGEFGDGMSLVSYTAPASVAARRLLSSSNARVGVGVFGGTLSLADSTLDCSSIDLTGETFDVLPPELTDLGGNQCGCPAEETCQLVSAGLAPPDSLPE
jgi:hypothetical protein